MSSRDLARIQRAVLGLYSHRDLESFRRAVPGIFLDSTRAQWFGLLDMRVDRKRRRLKLLDAWVSEPTELTRRFDEYGDLMYAHPFTQHVIDHGTSNRALKLSDFSTLPELRKSPGYEQIMKPARIGRGLTIGILGGSDYTAIALTRPSNWPDFSESDRRVLEVLRPHFEQARTNLQRETLLRASREQSLKAHGLTARETEVALWLAQGKSNPEIGIILARPARTIEKHVERILSKLGVENRSSAAVVVAGIIRA